MKHQYFGDISDYRKYCLLKNFVQVGGLNPLVSWLLTQDDERNDGNNNSYLSDPNTWKKHDAAIFDFLHNQVIQQSVKHLSAIEQSGLLPGVTFYSELLEDDIESRQRYFEKLGAMSSSHDLVFLDPDNGIETNSVRKGKKNSSKYIYLDEIGNLWNAGNSLLIYQHFPRVERIAYMTAQLNRLAEVAPAPVMLAVKTSFMAYFVLAAEKDADAIRKSLIMTGEQWQPHLEIYELNLDTNVLEKIDKPSQRRLL